MLSHVGERGEKDWNFEISDLSEKRRKKKKKKMRDGVIYTTWLYMD